MQVLPVSLFSLICQKACKIPHFYEIWVISGNNNGSSDDHALSEGLHRGCVIYTEKQLNCHALSCWHHSNNFSFRALSALVTINLELSLKHQSQILCGDNFYFEKINPRWKLLTGCPICDYLLKKRMMALQQMIDKKNTFLFIYSILSSFYPGQILSTTDFPVWDKICKIATNYLDLIC